MPDRAGMTGDDWALFADAVERAVRGACPELFEHPYNDFPSLVVGNVYDAIKAAGFTVQRGQIADD